VGVGKLERGRDAVIRQTVLDPSQEPWVTRQVVAVKDFESNRTMAG